MAINKTENDHSFDAETWDFSSWTDDTGVTHNIVNSVEEIPEEEFEGHLEEEFIYFRDENVRRYTDDSLESRYTRHYSEPDEGSVVLRAPSKLSWPTIASVIAVAINLLIAGSAFYFTQAGFNEKVLDKLVVLEAKHEHILNNVYTKRESDLTHDNINLRVSRNEESIKDIKNK